MIFPIPISDFQFSNDNYTSINFFIDAMIGLVEVGTHNYTPIFEDHVTYCFYRKYSWKVIEMLTFTQNLTFW